MIPNLIFGLILAAWLALCWALRALHIRGRVDKPYHVDLLGIGGIGILTVLFFWQMIFRGAFMPAGGGDLASFLYPTYRFAAHSLRSGTIPLWNPYLYGGSSFVGDIQAGFLYPINLLAFALVPVSYRTLEILSAFHFFLAGAFMYLCIRHSAREPLNPWAGVAGGVAFAFSDLFIIHFGNLNLIAVTAWLPLVFLLYHRAMVDRRLGLAAGAGIALGVAFLAGHFQPFLFIMLFLGLYFLYRARLTYRKSDGLRSLAFPLAVLILTAAVALGIAAPILLPSLEMSQHTIRSSVNYELAGEYSLPPAKWIGMLVPDFFGRAPDQHWSFWSRVEIGYLGILPLIMALLGILLVRERLPRFLAGAALLLLLLAAGGYGILHGWLFQFVPGFDKVRAPARLIFLMDFSLAFLAGLGLNALLSRLTLRQQRTLDRMLRAMPWIVGGLIVVVAPLMYQTLLMSQDRDVRIYWQISSITNGVAFFLFLLAASIALLYAFRSDWLSRGAFAALALGLIVVDLFGLGAYVDLSYDDPTVNFDHPAAIAFIQSDPDLFRIDTRTEVWDLWQPDTSLLHGIFDVWGVDNPLLLRDYNRYWENMVSRSSALYDFLNAKYIVGYKNVELDWNKFSLAYDGDPAVNVYLNSQVLPRFYVVHNAWYAADQEAAFDFTHRPQFDPTTTVVVEGGQEMAGAFPGESAVTVATYDLNDIALDVETPADGYLVTSEVFYPGWEATVDGQTAPILRANYAFRAIYLTKGTHRVELHYRPWTWRVGLSLAGATGLLLFGWGVWVWIRRFGGRRQRNDNQGG
jgi:hypothetical protein